MNDTRVTRAIALLLTGEPRLVDEACDLMEELREELPAPRVRLATLAWGFRQQPDPDDWTTDEWWIERETDVAYEWETDEWRRATHTMSETERAAAVGAHRHGLGVIGDRDDARDEIGGAR
ncbi:hypothetical protein KL864_29000 [Mycolicibacterium goodii]|uniref:microaggregate invasion protein 1 n=1 Tax=Mycolicibacterium goodii TaxID=134601 RepID=UPI001BDCA161|nr:hypothetical protein [Mycolicibacterium goodii]MBU8819928.1 hypothetical protein [Mycolicibacterium goodii]